MNEIILNYILLVSCITVLLFRIYQDSKRIEKLEKELVETLDKLFDEHQDAIRWEERYNKISEANHRFAEVNKKLLTKLKKLKHE